MIEDLWYKNTAIYSLDLETFMDANGDGVGDFKGLTRRLEYLESLGISTVWLSPFQPTPNLDDGYDICDYYGVDSRHGSSGDFVEFMHQAQKRGIDAMDRRAASGIFHREKDRPSRDRQRPLPLRPGQCREAAARSWLVAEVDRIDDPIKKECPEIGWGDWTILPTRAPAVLAMRYDWRGNSVVVVHNFDGESHEIRIKPDVEGGEKLLSLLAKDESEADPSGTHTIALEAYGYRWYRVGSLNAGLWRRKE